MNDLEFVKSCVKLNRKAQEEFVTRYSRLIYSYIYSVLNSVGGNSAQAHISDIFQEIFYLLIKDDFRKLRSFKAKNGSSLATWLRQVSVNATIDYLRKLKPALSFECEDDDGFSLKEAIASSATPVGEEIDLKDKLLQLKECIASLSLEEKYFIRLHISMGIKLEHLKIILRVSRGVVDMQKFRIITKLKKCFKRKGFLLD